MSASASASADTTVALADLPGISRDALALIVSESPGLTLVAQAATLDQLRAEVDATHPDVVVLDDRLLRTGDWPPRDDVRVVVIGLDDDPAYAARARRIGADAWIPKDRVDLLLRALLCLRRGVATTPPVTSAA
jgi:DNA-binding NarL/FixJ family response regulator